MKKTVVLSTGGTIASQYNSKTNLLSSGVLAGRALVDLIQDAEEFETIEVRDFCNIPSSFMTLDRMLSLAAEVGSLLDREDVFGIVVTHGTDTLEESSYLLDLVLDHEKPVVFTGSQRGPLEEGSDGASNLKDALRVARHPHSWGKGVLVVFNQEIHCAREVTKTDAYKLEGFQSPNAGPIGFVDGETVRYHLLPQKQVHFQPQKLTAETTLIKVIAGMDGRIMKCAVAAGYRGVVLEGFGRGHVPPGMMSSIRDAVNQGVSVVVTSRCLRGYVREVYDFAGSASDLSVSGALLCPDLSGVKARIKLAVVLSMFQEREKVEHAFHS